MLSEVEKATEQKAGAAIEARRAADRVRQQRRRDNVMSRDVTLQNVTGVTEGPSPKESPPTPPLEITPSPTSLRSVSFEREHAEFLDWAWRSVPKRKGDAPKPFRKAILAALRNGASPEEIRDGLARYAVFESSSDPQFRKGATVWVNAAGWEADYSGPPRNAREGPAKPFEKRNAWFEMLESEMAKANGNGGDTGSNFGEPAEDFTGETLDLSQNEFNLER